MRRAHLARWKRRVATYYGGGWDEAALGRMARTRTPCSCWMCGNPRRAFKSPGWRLPTHERRATQSTVREEMEEEGCL